VIAALLLAAVLTAPTPRPTAPSLPPAPPVDAAERAQRLEVALGRIHGRASPAAWRALGPEAAAELRALALDPAALPSRRARAVEGLSHLGGAEAEQVLRRLATQDGLPWSVRAEALEGSGRLLAPAELARLLTPVLQAASRPVERALAAEVLAEHTPAAACGAVRARAAQESAVDRPTFDRALSRCAAQAR